MSGPLAYSKHLAFAIRKPKKNILSYQSVSITMVSQFAVPGTDPVDIVVFSSERLPTGRRKWLGKSGWQDRGGWIDGIHGVSSVEIPGEFKEVSYMWPFLFRFLEIFRDMLAFRSPEVIFHVFGKMGVFVLMETCHFWPVTCFEPFRPWRNMRKEFDS